MKRRRKEGREDEEGKRGKEREGGREEGRGLTLPRAPRVIKPALLAKFPKPLTNLGKYFPFISRPTTSSIRLVSLATVRHASFAFPYFVCLRRWFLSTCHIERIPSLPSDIPYTVKAHKQNGASRSVTH